ncbi:hypothetical protein [Streptomyces johnsoniae]|uniref:Secreted protein n=1 Tax=Streptomyces johnsoniae TaxID=3075532 RepID=A0ABU2S1Y3_9ACTN|nr:hypothetical protein [Streptomyces sp. DSM 41886]MDT0442977.1 hypothetical protein [Streptomyces sp. DSM 41886]
MDLRENKSRLILIVVALGAALVIAVASCGGGGGDDDGDARESEESADATPDDGANAEGEEGGDEETPDGDEEEPAELLAEVTGEESITLAITRAEREAGGFLTVEGTVTNGGGGTWFDVGWAGPERELSENGFSMAGASVVANEEGKRYLILRDTSGRCLCTGFGTGIEAGATVPWFAQFPEPEEGTTEVSFQVGNMPPATIQIR